jgi:predicted Zn-dependent protease
MQITVDTIRDEKEDIQKAIEILNHFLNKQPKTNVVVQKMQQNTVQMQKPQQVQQPLQQHVCVQQMNKPLQQQLSRGASPAAEEEAKQRDEMRQLDPDLNNNLSESLSNNLSNNLSAKTTRQASQKYSNQDPDTEDFLNRMLSEIDKTNGDEDDNFQPIKEKEVVRVPFGSTEVVKRQQKQQQQENSEFTFEDLEKY